MVMFMVNGVDYSPHVVGDKYTVRSVKTGKKTYMDMRGATHLFYSGKKIVGSFDMLFKTVEEYNDFLDDIFSAQHNSGTRITVTTNYPENTTKSILADLDINPTRAIDGQWNDIFKQFTVKFEEIFSDYD